MNELAIAQGIDAAIKLITLFANSSGAQSVVSSIIAARINDGGRDWTDVERQMVMDAMKSSKAYAVAQSQIPD